MRVAAPLPAFADKAHDLSSANSQVNGFDIEGRFDLWFDAYDKHLPVLALDADLTIFGGLVQQSCEILLCFRVGIHDHLFTSITLAFTCMAPSIRSASRVSSGERTFKAVWIR